MIQIMADIAHGAGETEGAGQLVSVLVTVYNRERWLGEALESILASSGQDFEIIIVDDGSTDGSVRVARGFADGNERIRVYENDTNLGDYANRNRAASYARGRYLKYVDADDVIYSHALGFMAEAMERHPNAALGLSHSAPEEVEPYPFALRPSEAYQKHFLRQGCLNCGPSGAIILREAFESLGGFNPEWGVLGDAELWLRLAARSPVVLLPPGLVWWRRHPGQEYSSGDADLRYLRDGFRLAMSVLREPGCPLTTEEAIRARKKHRQHYARRLWSLALRQKKPGAALRLARDSGLSLVEVAEGLAPYRK